MNLSGPLPLRGQAGICSFNIKCSFYTYGAIVDYSDAMIWGMLNRGLNDKEVRPDILRQSRQDMLLEDALRYIEAKESGKRSASRLDEGGSSTVTATSSYMRQDKPSSDGGKNSPLSTMCSYCGKPGHSVRKREHMTKCQAYWKRCAECGSTHLFVNVCKKTSQLNAIFI
ncbi:retrovirus-related pol polyprotein from [Plakobranchus ocellatus]|uniref:Retrovirus-related pol polyprotein from n=1 Tax=Plakobranchus ocellatus TaxID=259542 RepID=A0AAV4CWN7_9GAST|nr:retrovirus-related pol polyprotein from [Plakobranchus ocellatus]